MSPLNARVKEEVTSALRGVGGTSALASRFVADDRVDDSHGRCTPRIDVVTPSARWPSRAVHPSAATGMGD